MRSLGRGRQLAGGMVALALAGCGSSGGGDGDKIRGTDLVVHGVVSSAGANGAAGSPLEGATVAVTIDVDGNGRISADERIRATTDANGRYEIGAKAAKGDNVVVSIRSEGYAPTFRRVIAGPRGEAVVNAALPSLEPLACENGRCISEGTRLTIKGLAGGVSGAARVFNPVTETHLFPGGFDDADGNLLISGVFSAVELQDENGGDVHELDEDVELRMQMPRDTWPVIVDLAPGNDRIDIPMYAFDEAKGTWIRHDKDGWLEDGDGAMLPESALESIRTGAYAGVVIAASEVNHFSYWNVDWPVESHGCIRGIVHTADGAIAEGASVTASGRTYTGTSASQTTDDSGTFALDVMRSEGSDDVDQDGTPGETHRVALRVVHGGKVYDAGEYDAPVEQGGNGENCGDLGIIELTPDRELQAAVCTATGRVFDDRGTPLQDALVYAWDDTVPDEVENGLCGEFFENCSFFAASGADGSYQVSTVVMDMLTVWSMHSWDTSDGISHLRYGSVTRQGCSPAPLDVTLAEGWDTRTLVVGVNGNSISWEPNVPVDQILVIGVDGTTKWMVGLYDDDQAAGFTGPVTYGTAPAGVGVTWPIDGSAPAPLASGDVIYLSSYAFNTVGIWTWSTGQYTVP